MTSPYSQLEPRAYWKQGVSAQHPFTITDLYRRKFRISAKTRIATAGSCFAQHIGAHLRQAGYAVLDAEPGPAIMRPETARTFGYGVYSARYGNIYLVHQLLQLAQEAFGLRQPADPVWERDGRFFDALRPSVEPDGLASRDEVLAHRRAHLEQVRTVLTRMNLFVFTLGLTEGWVHTDSGTVYPTAPGTIAGTHDPAVHSFRNFRAREIKAAFLDFRKLVKARNPKVRFLLTVSPVPLTATASGHHVLSATTYSKSVLRTVAGELAESHRDIDYFPSYELISAPFSRGFFYGPNLRTVEAQGVAAVMRVFFDQHPPLRPPSSGAGGPGAAPAAPAAEEIVCEEALLEAFAR